MNLSGLRLFSEPKHDEEGESLERSALFVAYGDVLSFRAPHYPRAGAMAITSARAAAGGDLTGYGSASLPIVAWRGAGASGRWTSARRLLCHPPRIRHRARQQARRFMLNPK
jgi:hypothetical protein